MPGRWPSSSVSVRPDASTPRGFGPGNWREKMDKVYSTVKEAAAAAWPQFLAMPEHYRKGLRPVVFEAMYGPGFTAGMWPTERAHELPEGAFFVPPPGYPPAVI